MRNNTRSVIALLLGALLSLAICLESQGSALVRVDDSKRVIQIVAQLNYFGPELTQEIADASTAEISRMWNEPKAEAVFWGQAYRIEFVITQTLNETATVNRGECKQNFIEVMKPTHPGDRSDFYMSGQEGRFLTSDELGTSSTTAHEFGHGLGLKHNLTDQRSAAIPGIMFARGTLVQPQFQWDPAAQAGRPGGTLKPHFRKVRVEDIQALPIERIRYTRKAEGCLGYGRP